MLHSAVFGEVLNGRSLLFPFGGHSRSSLAFATPYCKQKLLEQLLSCRTTNSSGHS